MTYYPPSYIARTIQTYTDKGTVFSYTAAVCSLCGAQVHDQVVHTTWHGEVANPDAVLSQVRSLIFTEVAKVRTEMSETVGSIKSTVVGTIDGKIEAVLGRNHQVPERKSAAEGKALKPRRAIRVNNTNTKEQ